MLDLLRGRDDRGVTHGFWLVLHRLAPFLDEPLHSGTVLAAWALLEQFEHLAQPLDLLFGFCEMVLNCFREHRTACLTCELR